MKLSFKCFERLVNVNLIKFNLFAGNHGKRGHQRQRELWNACKVLEIPAENITLVNATLLPDDPTSTWKPQIIAKQILKQVHSLDIDTIITFDRDGVSHHANHCAIFYASISIYLANLLHEGKISNRMAFISILFFLFSFSSNDLFRKMNHSNQNNAYFFHPRNIAGCRLFTLDSVNVCRKYSFLFDLLLSMTLSSNWCILNWNDFRRVQRAMYAHYSQMVWFRRLYIIFSRYMIINTLREVHLSDAELEMQIDATQKSI